MFFFCHDTSAPGNGGRKFICGHPPNDRYPIVFYLYFYPPAGRVPNSPTGQVLEAGPDLPVLVDVDDWTRLTWVIRSGLDWSQTGLYKRLHESRSGTVAPGPALTGNRYTAIVDF